jgi:hypothetical protein
VYYPLSLATSHLPDSLSLRLKDVRANTMQNSIVVGEHVEIAVADEAGSARRDS